MHLKVTKHMTSQNIVSVSLVEMEKTNSTLELLHHNEKIKELLKTDLCTQEISCFAPYLEDHMGCQDQNFLEKVAHLDLVESRLGSSHYTAWKAQIFVERLA